MALLVMEGQEIRRGGGKKRKKKWNPEHQQGTGSISYLRHLLCCQEYLVDPADLCLPFLPAHQEVQSGQSDLGDPVG